MNDQSFPTAPKPSGAGLGRRSSSSPQRESRMAIGPPLGSIRSRRRRTPRALAKRRRAIAFLTEYLEGRSVPSGFASMSLSSFASVVPSTIHSFSILAHDIATPSSLGGLRAVLAPDLTSLPILVEGADAPSRGVLGALDSVSQVADADPAGTPSSQGIAVTLPGVSAIVKPLPSSLDPSGGSPVANLPSVPTLPGSPDSPVSNPTNPVSASNPGTPSNPGAPSNTVGATPGGGSTATPQPSSEYVGAGTSLVASHAPSTTSTPGGSAQVDGSVGAVQPVAFVSNGGSAASPNVLGVISSAQAVSSTTGPSGLTTVSVPANDGAAMGQGRFENDLGPGDSTSADYGAPMASETTRAELASGDLESLERAIAQLMRRFDGIGRDLTGLVTEQGTTELLVAAGVVVVASDAVRRWERRRRLALPRAYSGSSGRPGPFYRTRANRARCVASRV
jgi:hypothetical protein